MADAGSPDVCPFGPEYQAFWNMRYELFTRFDEAQVDAGGLYTMVPEAHALEMARRARGRTVLDICSGIGSMSIAFARCGQQVTAVEIDARRAAMAAHNAQLYGVQDRIHSLAADITAASTLQALPQHIDTVWFDPPWGSGIGDYRKKKLIHLDDLRLAGLDLRELIGMIQCREVLFRMPPNFDIGIFRGVRGERFAFATDAGHLLWYCLRIAREDFLKVPDRSA